MPVPPLGGAQPQGDLLSPNRCLLH